MASSADLAAPPGLRPTKLRWDRRLAVELPLLLVRIRTNETALGTIFFTLGTREAYLAGGLTIDPLGEYAVLAIRVSPWYSPINS
jgi:hypothetical protein